MEKSIIIVTGNVCSGKSYVVKQLKKKGYKEVFVDDVLLANPRKKKKGFWYEDGCYLKEVYDKFYERIVKVLKKHPTLYVCTHFNHPKELTKEAMLACRKIVDNGIPIFNQSVLLKGVNDDSKIMKELLWGLVKNKVKPLYLQHCIKTMGNDHLVTKIDVGQKIIKDLYCHMSVLGIPLYDVILYSGKVLMMPDYVEKDEQGKKYFKNLHGEKFYLDNLE